MYKIVPTWDNGQWTDTEYETREEFIDFVKSVFKEPGQYQFNKTALVFNQEARRFNKENVYCLAPFRSKDFILYWNGEKDKCREGVIYKDGPLTWYLTRDYYMWLNFLPIYDKEEKHYGFAKVRDAQYHMALYEILAELHYKHTAILKKRQIASSYFHMGKIINTYWFEEGSTCENDLKILEPHLVDKKNNYVTKIGIGFDIHRFDTKKSDDTRNLLLGGIKISNIKSLIGHSDADVLLHAITDSILGVINVGDIGSLFPPSDKKWINQDSSYFLKHAKMLLDKSNGKINNIDAVVICEKPKILDYSKQMQENISHILKINPKRISIKGKTSESIGFIGREEGIAVMANTSIQIIENIYDD